MAEEPAQKILSWSERRIDVREPPARVVVVDDVPLAADALTVALSLAGYDAYAAYSGPEAVTIAENVTAHAVVLDIGMPVYDGFFTARLMRRLERTRGVIIVAHTAFSHQVVMERAARATFDAYFQKGQATEALIALLREFVQTS